MKITLIGGTGSGKTYFKYGLLCKLYSSTTSTFSIIEGEGRKRILAVKEELENELKRNEYHGLSSTPANDFRLQDCVLRYQGKKILDFDLLDPRGESFKVIALGEVGEETLESIINNSDTVIVFVDAVLYKLYLYYNHTIKHVGEKFKSLLADTTTEKILHERTNGFANDGTRISAILQTALDHKNINVIFALSKCDSEFISNKDIIVMKNNISKLYAVLKPILPSRWTIMDTFVVGQGMVKSSFDDGNFIENIPDRGYKFHNALSIFFKAILMYVENLGNILSAKKERNEEVSVSINTLEIQIAEKRAQLDDMAENARILQEDLASLQKEVLLSQKVLEELRATCEAIEDKVKSAGFFYQLIRKKTFKEQVENLASVKAGIDVQTSQICAKEELVKTKKTLIDDQARRQNELFAKIKELENTLLQNRSEKSQLDVEIQAIEKEYNPISPYIIMMNDSISKGE